MCVECVPPEVVDLTPRDHDHFFRVIGGRRCNTLNPRYVMPADEDELRVRSRGLCSLALDERRLIIDDQIWLGTGTLFSPAQRFDLFHRMIRFVFGNKNYVGPVEKVLSPDRDTGGERLRVLDLGTGGGLWYVGIIIIKPYRGVRVCLGPNLTTNVTQGRRHGRRISSRRCHGCGPCTTTTPVSSKFLMGAPPLSIQPPLT